MQIQTFSIVAGTAACNARCPFCISKMTPLMGIDELLTKDLPINEHKFRTACRLAWRAGCVTAMFTGKGEPTIYPKQITRYLQLMEANLGIYNFPIIEMQTNGILLHDRPEIYTDHLKQWLDLGMTTLAVSIVHYDPAMNRLIYLPYKDEYIDLPKLIEFLHKLGFSVRLTCIGIKDFIDGPEKLKQLMAFAKANGVEQLTFTPATKPRAEDARNPIWVWTNENHLMHHQIEAIVRYVESNGSHLWTLSHGAKVYDVGGQNLCLNECLTVQPEKPELRNLIFFPDGKLMPYWQFEGARLL